MVDPIDNPCEFPDPEPCGVNPAFTFTRYPCDFDDPRPADTRGLPVTIDLQTPVRGEVVNRQRESILAIEAELGIQPSGTYTTVRARLDALEALLCSIWNRLQDTGSPIDIQLNGTTVLENAEIFNFSGDVSITTNNKTATIEIIGGGSDGYFPIHEAIPVTSNGQTNFALSQNATDNTLLFFLGGIKQEIGDYTVNGSTVTWSGQIILTTDVVEVLYWVPSGNSGGGSGGLANFTQEVFTASPAQTNFGLSDTPQSQLTTELFIDGINQTVGVDYILSGSTVIYGGTPALTGGEDVVVKYFY